MSEPIKLTRAQLAQFLPDARAIRAFENIVNQAEIVRQAPDTQAISISAENALSSSGENAAEISRVKDLAALAATAPEIPQNNSVVTDYIDLPENGPHISQARRVQWNSNDGTLDVGLYGDSVLQVGQEIMYYAKNTSGSTITNGTPVMFNGAVGASGKLAFTKAIADGSVLSEYMMGVSTQDIPNNAFGYITSFGLVRGFDTTGSAYGEVWADGDLLYFGTASAGSWTKNQPIAPAIKKPIGVVVHAGSGGSGSVFVRMDLIESISKLQDVNISGLANNDMLLYDLANLRWKNAPQTSITSLGTITTGTWNATKIGLAYGGTNADLSATGGTSQVLKQVSAGANVTVGQLATTDLNDTTAPASWTPTFTCATVGDLSVSYATRVGRYTKIGGTVFLTYSLTFTPTFTTASGTARITGISVANGATDAVGTVSGDANKLPTFGAGLTQLHTFMYATESRLFLSASGSAATSALKTMADFTSGTAYTIKGSIMYYTT